VVGIEACATAHYWARLIGALWAPGSADPPVIDRCCGCRGDLRRGRATGHAFRTGEVGGSTSRTFASSSA
jgi:hypothetical protein